MEKTEHEAENCSYPEVNPEPAQPEVPLGDVSSQHQKTTQHPSNNLPGNAKQKATPKNWSNDVMFSAAFDEWNNHRPTNDKGRPMSMAMFCELRCIPRMTFLWHCRQNKDTINRLKILKKNSLSQCARSENQMDKDWERIRSLWRICGWNERRCRFLARKDIYL